MAAENRSTAWNGSTLACLNQAMVISMLLATFKVSCAQYTDARKLEFPKGFDPFKTLGIAKKGKDGLDLPEKDTLKKAYKKAALKWHPDRCKGDKDKCEKKMAEVALAQEVLSDNRKLQQWDATQVDRLGSKGPKEKMGSFSGADFESFGGGGFGEGGFGGFNFGQGGQRKKRDKPKKQKSPPSPPPPPPPKPREQGWKDVKVSDKISGPKGSQVQTITRELKLPNGQIKVEVAERTCYPNQVECNEKVLERYRRRPEKDEM